MSVSARAVATWILMALVMVSLVSPSWVAPPEPGPPGVQVTIDEIDPMDTDPVEYNHVSAKAHVTVTNLLLGATVKVNGSIDKGWLVTVDPEGFEVESGTSSLEKEISIDIRVPPKASTEIPIELLVRTNATTPLGIPYEDTATQNLTVRQYYGVQATTNGTASVQQGKNNTHRMRIRNTGNGIDNFTITLTNSATLAARGLELEFPDTVYEVGSQRYGSPNVQISAASDADLGSTDATFTIKSQGDPSKTDFYKVTITVTEATGGNGGNGGDDGNTTDEGDNRNLVIGGGVIIVIVVVIAIIMFMASRRMEEDAAEDEDYVAGGR